MKIEAPLRKSSEIEYLLEVGADLFYCGVLSEEKINNRHNSILHQFPDFDDLAIALEIAHRHGKKILLTLNSQKARLEDCLAHAKRALSVGIDGFIVTDVLLIKAIESIDAGIPIHLSVLAGSFNSESVKFYLNNNVRGFCMPRNISIQNMQEMVAKLPGLEVTAFVSGNCPYTQAFCQLHNLKTRVPIYLNEGGYGELFCEGWETATQCGESSCGEGFDAEGLLPKLGSINWCALCALPLLQAAGITNLKIEGRSLDTYHKVKKISYIKSALRQIDQMSFADYRAYCQSLYEEQFGGRCQPTDCYYRI